MPSGGGEKNEHKPLKTESILSSFVPCSYVAMFILLLVKYGWNKIPVKYISCAQPLY